MSLPSRKLRRIDEGGDAYRDMEAQLLPRGPIWRLLSQAGMRGMLAGLGVEGVRFHNRLVDLMLEAFPSTANELLSEWEEVFGLPLCETPETDDARRAALAARVAAVGGVSVAYFLDVIWRVLEAAGAYSRDEEPDAVSIERWPFGQTFRAWSGHAWETLGGVGSMFYWAVHLPIDTPQPLSNIIWCLLCHFKPAHTALVRDGLVVACGDEAPGPPGPVIAFYRSPGGVGDFLECADLEWPFDGAGYQEMALSLWVRAAAGADVTSATIVDITTDGTPRFKSAYGGGELDAYVLDDAGAATADDIITAYTDGDWHHILVATRMDPPTFGTNGTIVYLDGITPTDGNVLSGGTFATAVALWTFFAKQDGTARLAGDIANIAVFKFIPPAAEIPGLAAAGVTHDPRNATGLWSGYTPAAQWRDADVAGVVSSVGSEAHDLTLEGATTSEVL